MGLLVVKYAPDTLQDFLHVDNLVQGHIKAGQGLTEGKSYIAAGQAYFLSDNKPVNTLEFFKPLVTFLTEWIHFIVARIYNFQPILTRTEVYKTGVTHYFSIKKAQKELGYHPSIQNSIEPVLKYYIDQGYMKKPQSALMYYFVNVLISTIFIMIIIKKLLSDIFYNVNGSIHEGCLGSLIHSYIKPFFFLKISNCFLTYIYKLLKSNGYFSLLFDLKSELCDQSFFFFKYMYHTCKQITFPIPTFFRTLGSLGNKLPPLTLHPGTQKHIDYIFQRHCQ
ncbi:hypothetical protein KUTeg_003319 [Tegillarca granosa]|uniref:3-beta hydroxysteroid dehydrogenase/isomerase domain-containing protein n=1 Tax=Tegillarca granosa TaxID=220873 RepID=A0ABQ9FLU7_TEGGR|nr:hypothetical protein KUTeg_003319 [Tegillarca granosa]